MAELKSGSRLTFSSEGVDNRHSSYYSRKAHFPGGASGVTIGRGYDMKLREAWSIKKDLTASGVETETAAALSRGARLYGHRAQAFIREPEISAIELTEEQEITLFNIVYLQKQADAKRICQKPDVQRIYGSCTWESLDAGIREFVVDLTYRGDYTPAVRRHLQVAIAKNDYATLLRFARDKSFWPRNLDNNRFNARIQHLEKAAAAYRIKSSFR